MTDAFLKSQIITYMGNKRKLIGEISNVVDNIIAELNQDSLSIADVFSGSGIVSRLFKTKSTTLYTNDLAGYSKTLNQCFLSTPTTDDLIQIRKYITLANEFAHSPGDGGAESWIRRHWAPSGEIKKEDRAYFTENNALLIDKYQHFIKSVPKKYQCFLLAQLLVQSSIHNNTNGQFSAFYKDANGIGKYGGKKEVDIKRITGNIILEEPIFSPNPCKVHIYQQDSNEWVKKIPAVDIVYLDPPYNQHPYSIYYFLLDIINNWDTTITIPPTNRGQPKNWKKSAFNSFKNAEVAFTDLIMNIKAKYIILSYNNKGIIHHKNLEKILSKRGTVYTIPVTHKTYNKFKGIASYKRKGEWQNVKEFIWLVDLTHK
ncbi:MAG: DNA adenine methylase [Candidatus Neomarinimicrobiota bacterium]